MVGETVGVGVPEGVKVRVIGGVGVMVGVGVDLTVRVFVGVRVTVGVRVIVGAPIDGIRQETENGKKDQQRPQSVIFVSGGRVWVTVFQLPLVFQSVKVS